MMSLLRNITSGFRSLFRKEQVDRELDEELRAYQQMAAEEKMKQGMSRKDALRAVRLERGSLEVTKEVIRSGGWEFFVESVWQDLRFALRQWTKNPGFALTAVVVLALGMSASIAIFGFVDAALLQPLPYASPERLMSVNESNVESPRWPLSYPDYLDWERLNKSFSSLDIYNGSGYLLRTPSGALPVQGERVSGGFFKTLGVRPMLGRDFYPGEDRPGGPNVVVLSYGGWLHHFGGRRDAVGQTLDLDNQAYTVIGVLPRTFSFARAGNAEFWVPINTLSQHEQMRTFYNFWGVGRLRDSVTVREALTEMSAIAKQLQIQYPTSDRYEGASVIPLSEVINGDVRPILFTLLGGAGLLLVIACVNVASLVLVRSENRRREIAVRDALGAAPARLVRQFATEGLLLALFGSVIAVIFADWLMKILGTIVPKDMAANMPFLGGVGMNGHTSAFILAIASMAALLLSVTPLFQLSSQKSRNGLSAAAYSAGSQLWQRVGARMVVVELAVVLVLLAGASLLGQSLYRLLHVPLGFDPNRLASVEVMIPETVYGTNEQMVALYGDILRRVSSLPGVESAGVSTMLPVQCDCPVDWITFPARPSHGEHNTVDERHVSAGYLPTLRAALVRGRLFTDAADESRPGVVVINQALAQKYFAGEDPIGQRIADYEGGRPSEREIVGIVANVREGPLNADIRPSEYFPINQTRDRYFSLVVRTQQDAGALLPLLVSTVHQLDLNLGVSNEVTVNDQIASTQTALLHQFSAWLVGGFAAMALVLGIVGLYAVIAYSVSRRTREIGVRMALGAEQTNVVLMILSEAGKMVMLGVLAGLLASLGVSRLVASMLFGVSSYDPLTFACVGMVLSAVALVACYIPARRASVVDPMVALRYE
jgi:macrolide transport system ATP-binding/permease protein